MARLRTITLLVTLLTGSAASTLALSHPPASRTHDTAPATVETAHAAAPPPTATSPPPLLATATWPPPTATTAPTPPAPTATATPTIDRPLAAATPLTWPRTPEDDGGPALAAIDPTLAPPEAWFTQEALDTLRAEAEALLAGRTGQYSVVIATAQGYPLYQHEAAERHEAASLYKLAILVEVYRQRASGKLALDDVVRIEPEHLAESAGEVLRLGHEVQIDTLLQHMIVWSSNVAAWALLDQVGIGNVNRTMAGLGLTATFIELRPLPGVSGLDDGQYADRPHVTSAADMARLFELLLAGRVVSPEASAAMLDLLAQQSISNRLPAYLPWDTVVAHKTGNLPGIVHDVGVIFTAGGPLIVVVLTAPASENEATDVIARLGALAYHFGQAASDAQ